MTAKKKQLEEFERTAFPERYFEEAQKNFREYYVANFANFVSAEKAFRNLIVLLLKSGDFPEPKVSSRVKDRNECVRKFDRKYRNLLEEGGDPYVIADHISDMIGIRVVCIYEDDIAKVALLLKEHFKLIEETNKTKEIEDTIAQFGYKGYHLDLSLSDKRSELPEYKAFSDMRFEVQVRTIVQDAWSEVDHRLKYKKQTPPDLQRRILSLAALFEVADREFQNVRDESNRLEEEAVNKDIEVDEVASRLDLFGFLRVSHDHFESFKFQGDSLDTLLTDILRYKESVTVADFRTALEGSLPKVREYAGYLSSLGHSMTPYTQIRHCLYMHQPTVFEMIVFEGHRKNFDRWLRHGTVHPSEVLKK